MDDDGARERDRERERERERENITAAGEYVGVGRMDDDGADVVRVSLKRMTLLQSVVVEDSDQHVI